MVVFPGLMSNHPMFQTQRDIVTAICQKVKHYSYKLCKLMY